MSNQTNGRANGKPRRPRGPQTNFSTPEDARKFEEYIRQLRQWLNALSDEEHDKALKKLTGKELDQITTLITYENYLKGGLLCELLEDTCIEGTL